MFEILLKEMQNQKP